MSDSFRPLPDVHDPRPIAPSVESDEQSQRCRHQRDHGMPYDPQCFACEAEELCRELDSSDPREESWFDYLDRFECAAHLGTEEAAACLVTDREFVRFVALLDSPPAGLSSFVARYYDALDYRRAADQALRRVQRQLVALHGASVVKYGPGWQWGQMPASSDDPCADGKCPTCAARKAARERGDDDAV